MAQGLKLNLGCGSKILEGFVNVDGKAGPGIDLVHDVFTPLPFKDCEEIHGYHIFEHMQRWQAEGVLKDWVSCLKPGGLLVLELPCLDKVISLFAYHIQKKQPVGQWVVWGLFGDPSHKDPAMMHHWCYSTAELRAMMQAAGLQVTVKEALTHVPVRDMRLEGRKGRVVI